MCLNSFCPQYVYLLEFSFYKTCFLLIKKNVKVGCVLLLYFYMVRSVNKVGQWTLLLGLSIGWLFPYNIKVKSSGAM